MDETLKEIYLPYKKKIDELAKSLAKTLSIDTEAALYLIKEQIEDSEDKWIKEEKDNKEYNEMMEGSITVEAEIENMNDTYKTQCKNLTETNNVEAV